MSSFQLRRLAQFALPASASLLASRAAAQVVYTHTSLSTGTDTAAFLSVDLGDGLGGTGQLSGTEFAAQDFKVSYAFNNLDKPNLQNVSVKTAPNGIATTVDGNFSAHLAANATIDGALTFVASSNLNTSSDPASPWPADTRGYVGVSFLDDAETPLEHYGWIAVTYGADKSLTIDGFAYEQTPGVAILAGAGDLNAVPEPASTALAAALLAGSAALLHRRRQRASAA